LDVLKKEKLGKGRLNALFSMKKKRHQMILDKDTPLEQIVDVIKILPLKVYARVTEPNTFKYWIVMYCRLTEIV
jgi:hypothetical protein